MRIDARTVTLAIAGLGLAAVLGYAAHWIAGDAVGLSAEGIEAGAPLVPTGADVVRGEAPGDTQVVVPTATETDAVDAGAITRPATVAGPEDEPAAPEAASTPARARTGPAARRARGERLFASQGCGSCHALADARTTGAVGPDLDSLRPTAAEVRARVRSGGGDMPAFGDRLTDAQIADVAAYVAFSAGAGDTAPPSPAPQPTPAPAAEPPPPPPPPADDDDSGKGGDDSDDASGKGRGRGRSGDDRDD